MLLNGVQRAVQPPAPKDYSAPKVSSTEVEKLCWVNVLILGTVSLTFPASRMVTLLLCPLSVFMCLQWHLGRTWT